MKHNNWAPFNQKDLIIIGSPYAKKIKIKWVFLIPKLTLISPSYINKRLSTPNLLFFVFDYLSSSSKKERYVSRSLDVLGILYLVLLLLMLLSSQSSVCNLFLVVFGSIPVSSVLINYMLSSPLS